MADNIRRNVDGWMIKAARKPGGVPHKALRILWPGQPEQRCWGATVSGELRVFRLRKEDAFEMDVLGDFTPGHPKPLFSEALPWKHIYVSQSRLQKYLNALVARCDGASWYAHDIRIIGHSEIVYDLCGKGFHGMAQLWIQTQGKVVNLAGTWEKPVQRTRWVNPGILETVAAAGGGATSA